MSKRRYRTPPIVEVVAEFRFVPTSQWDATVPGRIYERLKDIFPLRRPIRHLGFEVQMQPEIVSFHPQFEEGLRFLRTDERAFIQLHPHRISIHHLAPYPHWEGFKPLLQRGYQTYLEMVASAKLQRIGLRYINRILLPDRESSPSAYFTLYPHIGESLPQDYQAFWVQVLFPFEDGRDALQLRLGRGEFSEENPSVVLLDLDYFLAQPEKVSPGNALPWMEQAHIHIRDVFEGVITDPLRRLFQEEVGE